MISTTTQFGSSFAKDLIITIIEKSDEVTKKIYQALWHALLSFLAAHLFIVITVLAVIFFIAIGDYIITGRWRMLGSVLYNYLYFGVLLVIGLIWGSDIFVSDIFHLACTAILYPICYLVTRAFLNVTGIRRH